VWFRRHTKITGGEATLQPGFVVLHSPPAWRAEPRTRAGTPAVS
jgi:hypothetical protein